MIWGCRVVLFATRYCDSSVLRFDVSQKAGPVHEDLCAVHTWVAALSGRAFSVNCIFNNVNMFLTFLRSFVFSFQGLKTSLNGFTISLSYFMTPIICLQVFSFHRWHHKFCDYLLIILAIRGLIYSTIFCLSILILYHANFRIQFTKVLVDLDKYFIHSVLWQEQRVGYREL